MEVEAVARAFAPIQSRDPGRIESPRRAEDALARVRGEVRRADGSAAFGGIALELSTRAVSASANAGSDPDAARRALAADEAIAGRPPIAKRDAAPADESTLFGRGAPESAGEVDGNAESIAQSGEGSGGTGTPGELTKEEEEEVRRLRARDVEVRNHENAHKAAAGRHARGGPKYEFERGPDGRRYAVGGEVSIDTSPVANDPDATILKMQQVRRAALAPAEPSSQDRKVASEASRTEAQARVEKREAQQSESADGARTRGASEASSETTGAGRAGDEMGVGKAEASGPDGVVARNKRPGRAFEGGLEDRRGTALDLSA